MLKTNDVVSTKNLKFGTLKMNCNKALMKKLAFTLAEVLITLGIIGVVSAMTIPALVAKHQKRMVETKLKETYTILANANRLIEGEYGAGIDMTDILPNLNWSPNNSAKVFDTYFAPHLKINFKYSQDDCKNLVIVHPQSNLSAYYSDINAACYNLMNGVSIAFWAGKSGSTTKASHILPITIYTTPQKKTKILGKDSFGFFVYPEEHGLSLGTFIEMKSLSLTKEQIKGYCNASTGRVVVGGYSTSPASFCAYMIKDNGWKIPVDYPIKF